MDYSRSPVSKFDTPENLAARGRAVAIWNSAPVEEIPLTKVIEMIYHVEESSKGSKAEAEYRADRGLLEEFRDQHSLKTLRDIREAFRSRRFDPADVSRWLESEADILQISADSLVEGYPEFFVGAAPSTVRSAASVIETTRRRYVDRDPAFGEFASFYSDSGKS